MILRCVAFKPEERANLLMRFLITSRHSQRICAVALPVILFGQLFVTAAFCEELLASKAARPVSVTTGSRILAFKAGEKLTYAISWSKLVSAGTATVEVDGELLPSGKKVLRLIAATRSSGLVDSLYPVMDTVQSVFDPDYMHSLTYSLDQRHGKKKKHRELTFDHAARTVVSQQDKEPPAVMAIPEQAQDALSALFYLRTRNDFIIGKPIIINVYDSGKNWSIEVHTLAREKVKTPAGEFNTIKVKTYPLYEGVFMNKGEIFIWLTDDNRKIPVLMQSTISIGSIMSTLTNIQEKTE